MDPLDLVSKLSPEFRALEEAALKCISPDDAKYRKASQKLEHCLSASAEWRVCALVQEKLIETRVEFGQADRIYLEEVSQAVKKIIPLNIAYLEDAIRHDQLALIEELGRFISPEAKALLHPGTTSYDILDTARALMYKQAWEEVLRPTVAKSVTKLCDIAEKSKDWLQVGRTHLQDTSPVTFGLTMAIGAARIANRFQECDRYFGNLKGKCSGIVGTGAGIEMVIGQGKSLDFEKAVLEKFNLLPDYTATQITQKERVADVGHGLTTMMLVLKNFARNMRKMYASPIREVSSADSSTELGGSSTDAAKDNPIQWENIAGKGIVVESGMLILYEMITSDFQRDLEGSVQARYEPAQMIVRTYESFSRLNKALEKIQINVDALNKNLQSVRDKPSEAMVTILRGTGEVHPEYGGGHDFVKVMSQRAKTGQHPLIQIAREDPHFEKTYQRLSDVKKYILNGKLEHYIGSAVERADINIRDAKLAIAA
ncbi:MAG: lyase family protein [archaeon]